MMKNKVNVAIQILPKSEEKDTYQIIDKAIEVIKESGIKYLVCPFETVLEGPYDEIMKVIEKVQQTCFDNGADELIVNIKIQNRKDSDVTIEEKMGKYV